MYAMADDPANNAHLAVEERAYDKAPRGKGDRGGRSRGGGQSREVQVSKALSKLLRHQADSANIKLDDEGYAPLDRVVRIAAENSTHGSQVY